MISKEFLLTHMSEVVKVKLQRKVSVETYLHSHDVLCDCMMSGDAISFGGGHEEENQRSQHMEVVQAFYGPSSEIKAVTLTEK